MKPSSDTIKKIKTVLIDDLNNATSHYNVNEIKVKYLGKKGTITLLMRELKNLSIDEKKTMGPLLTALREEAQTIIKQKLDEICHASQQTDLLKKKHFDVTNYQPRHLEGHFHPYTQLTQHIEDIFLSMGYEVLDGPEVETDFYNFTGLNIPESHPARDMYDTLWTNNPGQLLRTHTSPVQVRTMQTRELPIAAIVPGRVYRHEAVDASHDFMFMQCEGFLIDKNITLSHLFATAKLFFKALFGDNLDIRIRPGYFPFVEPGVEIDVRCPFCKKGCSVCKKTTWIEIFPGGLIHPNVLRAGGVDPKEYSGFAFGFGLSRLAMLKYNINDIRLFHSGKIKFLEQF
jgi:phenylalanyl-tRNA synthetase alpha chain